jgi:hypothetical protein
MPGDDEAPAGETRRKALASERRWEQGSDGVGTVGKTNGLAISLRLVADKGGADEDVGRRTWWRCCKHDAWSRRGGVRRGLQLSARWSRLSSVRTCARRCRFERSVLYHWAGPNSVHSFVFPIIQTLLKFQNTK